MPLGLFYGMPGWGEILIVAALGLLIFGRKRLPELGKNLGKSMVAFKKGLMGTGDVDDETDVHRDDVPTRSQPSDSAESDP